jgi:hypothetical protein
MRWRALIQRQCGPLIGCSWYWALVLLFIIYQWYSGFIIEEVEQLPLHKILLSLS